MTSHHCRSIDVCHNDTHNIRFFMSNQQPATSNLSLIISRCNSAIIKSFGGRHTCYSTSALAKGELSSKALVYWLSSRRILRLKIIEIRIIQQRQHTSDATENRFLSNEAEDNRQYSGASICFFSGASATYRSCNW